MIEAIVQKYITKEDLFDLQFINGAALSPDGAQVVYALLRVDDGAEKEYSTLWRLMLATGETRQMTADGSSAHSPAWSPDGRQIAFVSDRLGKPQIFVMPTDGGEAHPITDLKQGVAGGPVWSPDGAQIAFSAGPAVDEPFDFSQPYRITRRVYRVDNLGYVVQAIHDIYSVPAAGGVAQQLTHDEAHNTTPVWSPDSREILYLASARPDHWNPIFPVLRVVSVDDAVYDLTGDWGYVVAANWTPDGRILFLGQPYGQLIGSKDDLYVLDRAGGTPENRSASLDLHIGGSLQSDMPCSLFASLKRILCTDDAAWVRVQTGGTSAIYRMSLRGPESRELVLGGDQTAFPVEMAAGHLLYGFSRMNDPMQLGICDLNGQNARQLTQVNDSFLADFALPQAEHLLFSGTDGVQVEGWYLKPPQGQAPYPTILYIHGGPHGAFGHVFSFDFQMLAGAGYGVLIVNQRASTGYGDAFSTAIKGDWGNLDYHDLMRGVDEAIARGLADAGRLGVCGLSGGGNLTCWMIGQTDRFKAAVPENPVTNWVSFYGVSDVGVWFAVEQLGGHPHEIPDVYARCSPITYAYRCTTPTLLVQGEKDYRCPAEQSEQFYNVLKYNGCPVEMLRLPDSPHSGTIRGALASRRAHNEALLDWFARYIP